MLEMRKKNTKQQIKNKSGNIIFFFEIFIQTIMKIFDLRFINQKNCWLTLINFTFEKVLL